jgi:phosphatidylinositol alpha-1,6-mannosyltransferase
LDPRSAIHVFISENVPPTAGGVARVAFNLAHVFAESGYKTVLCGFDRFIQDPLYEKESFTVLPISSAGWRRVRDLTMARLLWRIWRTYRGHTVILYALTWKLARIARLVARRLGWKLVVFAHGTEITRSFPPRKRRSLMAIFRSADLCLGVSRYTADILVQMGIDAHRVRVLNNGVDTDMYYPVSRTEELREVHALRKELGAEDRVLILTLARVIRRKGQDSIIEALALLIASNRIPPDGVRYVIAGRGANDEIQRLRDLASRLGVQDLVVFYGRVPADAMRTVYNACDLYVMNSRRLREGNDEDIEGFGITFLEAGACGKPVIGGRSGGVPDAIADGTGGFLVDPENVEELADRIARLVLDPHLRERMGAENLRRAHDEFNIFAIGNRLTELVSALPDGDAPIS